MQCAMFASKSILIGVENVTFMHKIIQTFVPIFSSILDTVGKIEIGL